MRFSQAFTNKLAQVDGLLKIGDSVLHSNAWGSKPATFATVQNIKFNESDINQIPWDQVDSNLIVYLDNGHWAYGDQIKPRTTTAQAEGAGVSPGQAAADLGVDISSTEDGVHSEGKNPPNPRKKKKKKTKAELINIVEHIKDRFKNTVDIQKVRDKVKPFHGKFNINKFDFLHNLKVVEDNIAYIDAIKKPDDVISKFVTSIDINSAVNESVNKLSEVREILRNAEMVETDNTKRSILYDLDNKIRDLSSNIQYLSSNFF